MGLTDYKDHMGTNLNQEVEKWVGTGEKRFPTFLSKYFDIVCVCQILANPKVGLHVTMHWGGLLVGVL